MALENVNEVLNEQENTEVESQSNEQTEPEVNVSELMAQLNKAKAENEKLKSQYNKVSSEAADWRKKLNAKLSEDEKKVLAQTEAQEAMQNELKSLRETVAVQKATERYLGLGMDSDLAKSTANYEIAGDNESVTANIKQFMDSALKSAQNDWLANRPPANAGHGEGGQKDVDPFLQGFNNPTKY